MWLGRTVLLFTAVYALGVVLRYPPRREVKTAAARPASLTVSAETTASEAAVPQAIADSANRDLNDDKKESILMTIKKKVNRKLAALKKSKAGTDEYVFLQKTVIPAMRRGVLFLRRIVKSYDRDYVAKYIRESIEEAIESVREAVVWCEQHDVWQLTKLLLWCVGLHAVTVLIAVRYFIDG